MIFNKKYSKEEYEILKEKIIAHMKETEGYGEYFPPSICPVYYNETQGQYYEPMTKEEVLLRGWQWEDKVPGTFGKETIRPEELPDTIDEIDDTILKQILRCADCTKNFNITSDELTFYRREKIPLPRQCPECRYIRRFKLRAPRKLWHRSCMCEKKHSHHDGPPAGGCPNEFETSYSPDRPEKVYCEQCYQQEIL